MYPKTIFKGKPGEYVTEIVHCESEEVEFLKLGWDVADSFFKPKKIRRKRKAKVKLYDNPLPDVEIERETDEQHDSD